MTAASSPLSLAPLTSIRIAVLMGGPGSEREVSLASGKAIARALAGLGLEVVECPTDGRKFELPEGTGLVFNAIHGTFGEDGELQEILERRGIPYTGAGAVSSKLAFDKRDSKRRMAACNVPMPPDHILDLRAASPQLEIPLPCVMKPLCEGSSVGVHIIRSAEEIAAAVEDLRKFGNECLVERFISGRELTVGVLNDEALPVVEIVPRDGFYTMANKYPWLSGGAGSDYVCPAKLAPGVGEAVQAAALAAHRALGCEIYSRVDVMLEADADPYVLEVNTIPGMTETSLLPKAAAAHGIPFPELCARIAMRSLARFHAPSA